MGRYTLYAVNIDIAAGEGSDVLIDQITDFALSPGIEHILRSGSGSVDPTFVGVMNQNPRASWSTTALATVLAKCGIAGLAIAADVDELGCEMFFNNLAEGSTRGGDGTNVKLSAAEGLLVPRTINAPHGGEATLSMELIPTWDGTLDPIVIATAQNLVGSPAVGELFTVGPVKINGATVTDVQNITINFGITEIVRGGSGSVWPTFVGIMSRTPSITVVTDDVDQFNTLTLPGVAQGATNSVVYLTKMAEGSTRTANATAEHISFTIDEGHIAVTNVGGSHGAPLTAEITITPTYDGTDAILVVSTATAIT